MRTLFTGGKIQTADIWGADWLLVDGDRIAGRGTDADRPTADHISDLEGGTLTQAFCDAHVHLPATGLYAQGMDFREEHSADTILDAFRNKARDPTAILFGGNFEDPLDRALTAKELDSAVGDRAALLARADMHSCVVSSALLAQLDLNGVEGADRDAEGTPTGYLREHAAAVAWKWFDGNLTPEQQKTAVEAAASLAYSKGVASVHEMFVVEWRGWSSLETFLSIVDDIPLRVITYPATAEIERVRALGLDRIGGDFFLDGSFGSHTAWLSEPYESTPPNGSDPCGTSYRTDEELIDFFSATQAAGMQTGVHAIGDAAIEQAIRCWESVAADVGLNPVASLGHRIEHFECATIDHMRRAARLGLRASVQPAFDWYWGGDGLYKERIGERAREMNRFRSMLGVSSDTGYRSLMVGAGSDSTVTPLDPFLQMAALQLHHREDERLSAAAAFGTHTMGSLALADDTDGMWMRERQRADLVLMDRDPLEVDPNELLKTEVLGTWIGGQRVWPA
jgi:predicted amidohydrolase YtcJ